MPTFSVVSESLQNTTVILALVLGMRVAHGIVFALSTEDRYF
jgi:hypothetical protein